MPRRLTNAERLREADRLSEALEQLVDVSTVQRAYVEGVIAGLRGEVPDSLTRRQQ